MRAQVESAHRGHKTLWREMPGAGQVMGAARGRPEGGPEAFLGGTERYRIPSPRSETKRENSPLIKQVNEKRANYEGIR